MYRENDDSNNIPDIREIIDSNFKVSNIDGLSDENVHVRFESIINFLYFLLHTLRVFVEIYNISLKRPLGDLLDDKKLISDFDYVIKNGKIDEASIKMMTSLRCLLFIFLMPGIFLTTISLNVSLRVKTMKDNGALKNYLHPDRVEIRKHTIQTQN